MLVLSTVLAVISGIFLIFTYAPDHDLEELRQKYRYPDSQFVDFEGMRVHYRDVGTGPTVVLLHGLSSSLHTWEGWTSELSKDFRVITLDLPGFGLTGPFVETKEYTIDNYLIWLNRFFKTLGLKRFSLGGNSFGGNLSWRYAALYPEQIDKLMLVNSAGFSLADASLSVFRVAGTNGAGWFVQNFTPQFAVRLSVLRIYGDRSKVTDKLVTRYYDLFLRPGNRQSLVSYLLNLRWDQTDLIESIKVPTLVMWGTEDNLIPFSHSQEFMKRIKGARLVKYEGVGHVPMEEIPKRSAADARAFLLE